MTADHLLVYTHLPFLASTPVNIFQARGSASSLHLARMRCLSLIGQS